MKFRAKSVFETPARKAFSKCVAELFGVWESTEAELSRIAHELGALGDEEREARKRLEREEDQFHDTLNAAILTLLESPSRSVHDVLCKLKIWRSMTAPISGMDDNRTPLERLALAAVEELSAMRVAPTEQRH